VRAKEEEEADKLIADAILLEKTGCFAIVLEKVPAKLAQEVSEKISIPVIGIGAGNGVDGQVLVTHDMIGMTHEFNPRFLRRYLYTEMKSAFSKYSDDVKSGDFPNDSEQY
jgi:3-methyl-2-oxobutanoate hydroxymethyltransferase